MKKRTITHPPRTRRAACAAAIAGVVALGVTPSAFAASTDVAAATSANWSGYVAGGSQSGGSQQFSSVSGSWVEPTANCSSGSGVASFWVGLGGSSQASGSLEQTGTQAECNSDGTSDHFAWYELVPAAPVKLGLTISAGDHISARVSVSGSSVTVSMTDQTTRQSATKTLQMDSPDTSSAEWIAEAPSECSGSDASDTANCTPLPLANFGTVSFTNATATANGTTSTIGQGNWTVQPVQLSGGSDSSVGYAGQAVDTSSTNAIANATPSSLSSDGSSFSVTWQSGGATTTSTTDPYGNSGTSSDGSGYGGDGYGGGYPGISGYGGYGGGYGYGYSGYGGGIGVGY